MKLQNRPTSSHPGVEVVGRMELDEWREICHRHVKRIVSCWELQTSGLKRDELIERVMEVQANMDRLEELMGDEETHVWFRMNGRLAREDDDLGPFKYRRIRSGADMASSRVESSRVEVQLKHVFESSFQYRGLVLDS